MIPEFPTLSIKKIILDTFFDTTAKRKMVQAHKIGSFFFFILN